MALVTNCVAYYKLDESSGNAADATGGGFTLTNTNSVAFVTGKINNGADFGNTNSTKLFDSSNDLGISTGACTISAWVNMNAAPASGGANAFILAAFRKNSFYDWSLRYDNNGGTFRILATGSGGTQTNTATNQTLTVGTWYHLAMTYDGGSTVTLYFNGSSSNTGTNPAQGTSGTAVYLGASTGGTGQFASCKIDEVGYWSRALSGAEITSLYNGGTGIQYPFTTDPGDQANYKATKNVPGGFIQRPSVIVIR